MKSTRKQPISRSKKSLPSTRSTLSEAVVDSASSIQLKKGQTLNRKKQKTSTPSKSRIEHYMSPGNISKIVGSPIQPQRSVLERRSALDSVSGVSGGERSSDGQRSSGSGDAGKKGKSVKKKAQSAKKTNERGTKGDNSKKSVEKLSSDNEKTSDEEESASASSSEGSKRSIKTTRQTNQKNVTKLGNSKSNDKTPTNRSTRERQNASALENATIDKFMSPDRSCSVITTPTRFPSRGAKGDSSSDEYPSSSQSEDRVARGSKERPKKVSKKSSRAKPSGDGFNLSGTLPRTEVNGRSQETGSKGSSLSTAATAAAKEVPSTSGGVYQKQATTANAKTKSKGAKRKSSDSVTTSASKKKRADDGYNISDDDEMTSDEDASIRKIKAKGSNRYMASGDIDTHMADKDFLANQVHTLSKPFTMNSGPRDWIQIWKAQQSTSEDDEEETDEIPERVIHKAISKLNSNMTNELGRHLSRHQQRKILIKLDELRREKQDSSSISQQNGRGMLRIGASLNEIVDHYPSEWPGTDNLDESASEEDRKMADRYGEVHARLFALSCSLTVAEQKRKHLQDLLDQLKDIDSNLKSCTDSDFKKELSRTKSLVSQVYKKLKQRRSPRKSKTSSDQAPHSRDGTDMRSGKDFLGGHEALVRHLLASAL